MGCIGVVKAILVIANIIFMLIGFAIIAVGVDLQFSTGIILGLLRPYLDEIQNIASGVGDTSVTVPSLDVFNLEAVGILQTVAIVFIAVGAVIAIIGILGFIGTCASSKILLGVYNVIVGLLFAVKLAGLIVVAEGIVNDAMKGELQQQIDDNYSDLGDFDSLNSILLNFIMITFDCCGIDGHEDFDNAANWDREKQLSINGAIVIVNLTAPLACCDFEGSYPDYTVVDDACALNQNATNSNLDKGCWQAVSDWIETQLVAVYGVCAAILVVELLCVVFGCCVCFQGKGRVGSV